MNNQETIQLFIHEVFNKGNLSIIHEMLHHDYTYTSPTESMEGPAELAAFVVAFRSAFPDLKIEVLEQVSQADTVCTRIRFTGSHHGEFLGMPATDKSVDVEGCVISEFKNNLIHKEWEILDQLTLLQQLGAAA